MTAPAALPTVVVLAAGQGQRFRASGGQVHKLQALLHGVPVMEHVLACVRTSGLPWHVVQPLAHATGQGMDDSLMRGILATPHAPGWLVLPADLPLVQPHTLRAVARALQHSLVAVPRCAGQRGHPVGFSAACREALLTLHGDQGAAAVVRAHQAQGTLQWVEVEDAGIYCDIDTVEDLQRAHAHIANTANAAP